MTEGNKAEDNHTPRPPDRMTLKGFEWLMASDEIKMHEGNFGTVQRIFLYSNFGLTVGLDFLQ